MEWDWARLGSRGTTASGAAVLSANQPASGVGCGSSINGFSAFDVGGMGGHWHD